MLPMNSVLDGVWVNFTTFKCLEKKSVVIAWKGVEEPGAIASDVPRYTKVQASLI